MLSLQLSAEISWYSVLLFFGCASWSGRSRGLVIWLIIVPKYGHSYLNFMFHGSIFNPEVGHFVTSKQGCWVIALEVWLDLFIRHLEGVAGREQKVFGSLSWPYMVMVTCKNPHQNPERFDWYSVDLMHLKGKDVHGARKVARSIASWAGFECFLMINMLRMYWWVTAIFGHTWLLSLLFENCKLNCYQNRYSWNSNWNTFFG